MTTDRRGHECVRGEIFLGEGLEGLTMPKILLYVMGTQESIRRTPEIKDR